MNISYNWLKDLIEIEPPAAELAAQLTRVGLAVEGVHSRGDDFVFDIDLTSNRPDCLSHLGVAREISVLTGKEVYPKIQTRPVQTDVPIPAVLAPDIVKIEAPQLCHRFTARVIRNVKIGPSSEFLVRRLEAVGERAINNVADITNYVMLELGQPMHAFDLDKLGEGRIVIRQARPGEMIKTLDEIERKLDPTMLAICDAEKPVAVAGVMGGFDAGITEQTTDVLLEVAYFQRESVRATSRKLGLVTEASYRFERGVDIENLKRASDRATELICEITGGKAGEFVDAYPMRHVPGEVGSLDISTAVKRLTGLGVSDNDALQILDALGIIEKPGVEISSLRSESETSHRESEVESQVSDWKSEISNRKARVFAAPSWRHDLAIEEDLVEEVARHLGYENIKDELPPAFGAGEYQATEPQESAIRQTLVNRGFDEALNYSFIDIKHDDVYEPVSGLLDERLDNKFVELRDSVIEGAVRMRPTLLPGLLDAVRRNFNYQNKNLQLFEIGKVFAAAASEDGLPRERELLAMAITGSEMHEDRGMPGRELDFYDAKGAVESALESAGYGELFLDAAEVRHLRKGQSASVIVHGKPVGTIGRLNEEIAANYKFRQPVYVAEIDLRAVLAQPPEAVHYAALPRYPAVVRDVSFAVGLDVTFGAIRETIAAENIELCRKVTFVDIYVGKGIEENKRSITIRIEYRSDEGTLLETDVEQIHGRLIRAVEENLRIKQRI